MTGKVVNILLGLICTIALISVLKRDIFYKNDYPGDLRNRVVGARLIADGKLPYYFKWSVKDGLRYYDPYNFSNNKVSNITASPFLLSIMRPLSPLPQKTIIDIWFWAEYLIYVMMVLISLSFCESADARRIVLLVAVVFLFTDAWKAHIIAGQIYIIFPFLMLCFLWLTEHRKTNTRYFFAGIAAAALVLIRPNAALFFLPFLMIAGKITASRRLLLIAPLIILTLIATVGSFQRTAWKEYFSAIKDQTAVHQGTDTNTVAIQFNPRYQSWEGIRWNNVNRLSEHPELVPTSENGNVFVIAKKILGLRLNTFLLTSLSFFVLILFSGVFFLKVRRSGSRDIMRIFVFGYWLYMISDLFSPIYRHQYYTVQWLGVLLILFANNSKLKAVTKALLVSGIILNLLSGGPIKLPHSLGEYIFAVALLICSFQKGNLSLRAT